MWSIMLNIFNLIKNVIDIIINKNYIVVGAKYDGSRMNDACTVCPADFVSLPAKVLWPTGSFKKRK